MEGFKERGLRAGKATMGDILSTLSSSQDPTHSTQPTNSTVASSNPSQTHHSSPQTTPTHQSKTQEESSDAPQKEPIQSQENDTVLDKAEENNEIQQEEEEEEEEEEEGECGFCLFMKGGECREVFIEWEKCVEEGEMNKQDIVNKCYDVTKALKECIEAHPDYYGPVLRAEAELAQELQTEKEGNEGSGLGSEERKGREAGDSESASVSEPVATIEVDAGENSCGAEKEQSS